MKNPSQPAELTVTSLMHLQEPTAGPEARVSAHAGEDSLENPRGKENKMTSNEISIVEAFIAAINRRDPYAISDLMTDDHTFIDSSGRIQSGRESMTTRWKEYFRIFPDYQIHVESLLADKALVAVFGSASGTYNGKRGLVAENRITMPAAWRVLVENGKVKRWQVYAD